MRLIHSSDWQIGKVFRMFDHETEVLLQRERVEVIARLGKAARDAVADAVLVAGDVWDQPRVSDRTLSAPMERMRGFPDVEWHLIPGNHDPHTPGSPWSRLLDGGLPANVRIHVEPEAAPIRDGKEAWVLPAPLGRRHALGDPTEAMDGMSTPPGVLRVGLAHGSARDFDSDGAGTRNRIASDRVAKAALDYLALGDWHGQKAIDERTWYSGTPEADGFDQIDSGKALLVELSSPKGVPVVTSLDMGRYRWIRHQAVLHSADDIDMLEAALRRISDEPHHVVLHLEASGAVSLADRARFERQIRNGVCSGFAASRIEDLALLVEPTADDLDAIDHAGFVRAAADRLRARATNVLDTDREIAALALRELWVLHSQEGAK